jgi:hypothetical protein
MFIIRVITVVRVTIRVIRVRRVGRVGRDSRVSRLGGDSKISRVGRFLIRVIKNLYLNHSAAYNDYTYYIHFGVIRVKQVTIYACGVIRLNKLLHTLCRVIRVKQDAWGERFISMALTDF